MQGVNILAQTLQAKVPELVAYQAYFTTVSDTSTTASLNIA